MTTQHTSGPWIVKGGNVIENESGVNIAKAWMTDREEECANARLISAAPELLSALKEMMSVFQDHEQYDEESAEVVSVSRAAIAKAEGK